MWKTAGKLILLSFLLCLWSCNENVNMPTGEIQLLNATINGRDLKDDPQGIDIEAEIRLTFSKAVNLDALKDVLELLPAGSFELRGINQNTGVSIEMMLQADENYQFQIMEGAIGAQGESLRSAIIFQFSTAQGAVSICSSASEACRDTVYVSSGGDRAGLHYYSSLSFTNPNNIYINIDILLIAVHGINRNANEYFNFVLSPLMEEELESRVLVVAPEFPEDRQGEQLYWSSRGWREGQVASGPLPVSSFTAMDSLVKQITKGGSFPNLKKILVTGHSSGGLFTHLYSAANEVESETEDISFDYIIANSQYFYYPDGRRVQGSGGNKSLFVPQDCSGYDIWPIGYRFVPSYLNNTSSTVYNERFKDRSSIYLLGDLNDADPTLNTTDCYATLLGPTRYERGLNMFSYMELAYGSDHNHREISVPAVGHDAAGMYYSGEFRELLKDLLEE